MFGLGTYLRNWKRKRQYIKKRIYVTSVKHIRPTLVAESPVKISDKAVINDHVVIGKYTYIEGGIIYGGTTIGRYCSIATNVQIGADEHPINWLSTSPFQYSKNEMFHNPINFSFKENEVKKTIIENDVWIGTNACIKKGVTVHNGAIIASGAVVTKDVPPYAIVGGCPAKVIKYRFEEDIVEKLLEVEWWNLPEEQLASLPYNDICAALKRLFPK